MTDTSLAIAEATAHSTELAPAERAKLAIARAIADEDVESLFTLRALASAAELARTRIGAQEAANEAGEIKVRAERGLAILDIQAAPQGRPAKDSTPGSFSPLAELRTETRAQIRKLAKLDDAEFETRLEVARADEISGVSTKRVLQGQDVHFSSQTPEWATPQDLFDQLDAEFGFTLDVCATHDNHKCPRYFTEAEDGLAQEWAGVCWMNPPYGDEIPRWVEKAHQAGDLGATVVCLVPARTDTGWWWDHCISAEIRFLRGRLKFGGGANSAPFPSAVVIFGREPKVVWWER